MLIRGLIAILALGVLALVWRWRTGTRHPILLGILGAGLIWATYVEGRMVLLERSLSAIASDLAGAEVAVHCQRGITDLIDVSNRAGYVPFPADGSLPDETFLRKATCQDLASYRSHPDDPSSIDEVVAVHVLTHEIAHMRGVLAEAAAECQAMQRDAATARALGARESVSIRLAGAYWRSVFPSMPPNYVDPECQPGGSLDEGLGDGPWPAGTD